MSPRGTLTPDDCEILVARELRRAGIETLALRRTNRGDPRNGDGWRLDLLATLQAYGRRWSAFIECRNTTNPASTADIEDARRRADAAGARSALVFATCDFEADATMRARELRVALLQIVEAQPVLLAAGLVQPGPLPAWVPELTVELITSDVPGVRRRLLEADQPEIVLRELRPSA